jgi:hypothetical protein
MAGDSPGKWSDTELADAVAASVSWRGLMRTLGLPQTSPQIISRAKQDVARLDLDTSHFTKQRAWSDDQFKAAIAAAQTQSELIAALGLQPGSNNGWTRVKATAVRLGLDLRRLENTVTTKEPADHSPDLKHLRQAATSLAACWFSLCGFEAAIPLEPAVYDLLVSRPDGIKRVQVKTTTHNTKSGWVIQVGRRPYSLGKNARLVPYDPDLIDLFFVVDGDMSMYLIPSQIIAGRVAVLLRAYSRYIVGQAAGLMASRPEPAALGCGGDGPWC